MAAGSWLDASGGAPVWNGRTRDIPLAAAVRELTANYLDTMLPKLAPERITPDTPLFWSSWGRRVVGQTRAPMTGKNLWRLCKQYRRMIGYPDLKPHDLRHGVGMEVYEAHQDIEAARTLLGHARLETTQIYATIRPKKLKEAVSFYEERAQETLGSSR